MEETIHDTRDDGLQDWQRVPNNANKYWWLDGGLRWNVLHCAGLCATLFFNGYDGSLFNGLQTIDAWEEFFGHPSGNLLGLMNSAALFPGLITPFFVQILAERWGRRWPIWIGSVINIAGAIVNAASLNLGMYIAGRAMMGVGIAMGITIAPALLQEIAHPRYRAPLGSMYTSIYYIAAVISASICLGTGTLAGDISWRIPCYLQVVGPAATLAMTLGMSESPRWLAMHGRSEEALTVLARYHANGLIDDPLVQLEYNEIQAMLSMDGSMPESKYQDFLKRGNRRRLLIILTVAFGTNWVGNGIITYYLSSILSGIGITSSRQQSTLNVGLQVWNLILSFSAALSVDKVGRRPLWLASTIGLFFSLAIIMGLSGSYSKSHSAPVGTAVVPFLFIFFGFYVIAWTPLSNMYTVEVLPYHLRAKGLAIYCIAQNGANAFNQWVNPIALDAIEWRYYGVYLAVQLVLITIIYFNFAETKNLTIEEIAGLFDGDFEIRRNKMTTDVADDDSKPSSHEEEIV